jgi:serine/threonine-protein kinase
MIGQVLAGRYEVTEVISASPIFENYVAKDRYKGGDVCLRVLNPPYSTETEFVAALGQVVAATSTLDHPNVAKVYGLESHEGRPFVVCELIKGSNLVERIRRVAPFSPPVACELAIGICEGLAHAAEHEVTHGDLCADHVLATLEGRVAVVDFGLWKCYSKSASAGGVVLSRMAAYMAPEIIDGEFPTTRSDVYAVGVILFELLTGRLPFSGQTPGAILAKHKTLPAPSPRSINAAVSNVLDEITLKCLSKEPGARYADFTALIADLRATRDAMRFGKQLTWPIVSEPLPVGESEARSPAKLPWESSGPAVTPTPRPQQVADAVVQKPVIRAKRVRPVRDRSEDDVPLWFRSIVYGLIGVSAMFVIGWMVMNATKRKEIQLPNLVGMTIAEARQRANRTGFQVLVDDEIYSEKFPQPDTIVQMQPDARTPIREGAIVRVVKSLGSKRTDVPDLRGASVEDAKERLLAAGLVIGDVREIASDEIDEGQVAGTEPARGERVDRKTTIDILVSGTPDNEKPARERPNTWTLRFQVKESDEPVLVRVDMTDGSRDKRTIFEEVRSGGEYVELLDVEGVGERATFRIYFDDYLNRTIRREGNNN